MRVMEVDNSKCLICEVSCHQKGLTFFRFPKEETRLKMWIKEITPLLNILKIQPNNLKENGRICARHFRERDFINHKQNSLVRNACPSLSVSNLNINFQKKDKISEEGFGEEFQEDHSLENNERDIFQCGKCKTQFEILSDFMDHKRFTRCQSYKSIREKTETVYQDSFLSTASFFNSSSDGIFNATLEKKKSNFGCEQIIKINRKKTSDNKIMSLVVNDGSVFGNSLNISPLPAQVILTPQPPLDYNGMVIENPVNLSLSGQVIVTPHTPAEGSILCHDIDNETINNLIISSGNENENRFNSGMVYSCPIQNNRVFITSACDVSQVIVANEVANSSDKAKDSSGGSAYSGLTNVNNSSQQNFLLDNSQSNEKDKLEILNQTEENEFEKSKNKLPCSYCGKLFEKPFNLQQHERIHTGERPFQCIICGRAFTQKANVRKHMVRHRVWPQGKQTLKLRGQKQENTNGSLLNEIDYSCQYCSLSFKSYAEHKKHLAIHSNIKVYRCIQQSCNETFVDLDEFLSHSKMHSSAEFQCHICLKVFTNLEELGVHQYDHDTTGKEKKKEAEIKLKCKVCHARFKTAESLKNHLAVDTHNYECAQCKSVFCSERFLRRHLFIHMDFSQSKHRCQNCKKVFRTQQNLKNHMFIHLKEKPFTCDHCDKQFASKYRLKRHVAIHLDQHLECPFKGHLGCDKTFYRKDKLRDHVNTHSHCKLRSCRICSKLYWTLTKLNQHMKKDHKLERKGKEILKCHICSQTFRKHKQLTCHHCTVEEKKSKTRTAGRETKGKEVSAEAVSNIEIIMVPFGAKASSLT